MNISDSGSATVSIAAVPSSVSESAGTITFEVTLNAAVAGSFTVDYKTVDGTAKAGSDYTAKTATLTFPANSAAGSKQSFTVDITDDNVVESSENFTAEISNVSGGLVTIGTGTATATITDNDAANISIADLTVDEADVKAVVKVTLNNAVQDAFTFDYTTSDNTAKAGSDYTAKTGTLTFPAGSVAGTELTIEVPINDDAIVETSEDFTVTLSNLNTSLVTISKAAATVTITDNDVANISIANITSNEATGKAKLTVTLSNAVQDQFTVKYTTSDNSAKVGDNDYSSASGVLTFPAGSAAGSVQEFEISINDDLIREATEDFKVTLSDISTNLVTISKSEATVTITDNDAASISIADVSINEADGKASVTVTLNNAVQNGFAVDYTTSDNSAEALNDYTAVSGTLTFPANSAAGTIKTIEVPIIDDAILEGIENFKVSLSNLSTPLVTIGQAEAIVTINDNEAASISIANVTVDESAGKAILTVTLNNSVQAEFKVDYATSDNTAKAGSDYTSKTGTLTFPANSPANTQLTIEVPITDDNFLEKSEQFKVTLSNITGGLVSIANGIASVTITDNDNASISIADITVNEAVGNATVTVTLDNPVQDAFDVDYSTADGTALDGDDYTAANGTLSFVDNSPAGATRSFTIAVNDDDIVELTEDIKALLQNITGGLVTINKSEAIIQITDNDEATVTVSGASDGSESSTPSNGKFKFTLSNKVSTPTTVNFTVTGTAISGSDYTSIGTSVVIPANTLSVDLDVPVLDDLISEQTETVDLVMNTVTSNSKVTADPTSARVNITDNDGVTLELSGATTVNEDAGTITYTVKLAGTAGGTIQDAVTVKTDIASGTADSGSDFDYVPETLTFPAGSAIGTSRSFTVSIVNDDVLEGNEDFTVNIKDAVGIATIGNNSVTTVISDNDAASISIADVTVNENAGTATFTVKLTGNIQNAFDFDYATADGTALAGSDYTAKSGTLNFAGGSVNGAVKTITIDINDDNLVEEDETYNITLSDITGGLATISQASAIGTIVNNDADVINDNLIATEDQEIDLIVLANDKLTGIYGTGYKITSVTNPSKGTVAINTDGTINFIPTHDENGNDSFTYTVTTYNSDGSSTVKSATVALLINAVNDLPVVTNPPAVLNSILEDSSFSGNSLITDIDGDVLNYGISVLPAHGHAIVNSNGDYSYKPDQDYNGSDEFTVKADDGNGGSVLVKIALQITPVNDVPSFTVGLDQSVLENSGAHIITNWATDLSTGPSNESNQKLTFEVTNSNNALFSSQPQVNSSGDLTFTPSLNAEGVVTVTVYIKDDGGVIDGGVDKSSSQSFTITIRPTVITAAADAGSLNGFIGGVVVSNVLSNDTYNGNPVTFSNVKLNEVSSTNAKITLNPADGSVNVAQGTPEGIYTLRYRLTDMLDPNKTSEADVTITVTKPAITAASDNGTINGFNGGVVIFNVLENDTYNDVEATVSTITLTQVSSTSANISLDPTTGKVVVAPNTPTGSYTLTYQIADKVNPGSIKSATIEISVTAGIITAVHDAGTVNGVTGGVAVPSVLSNDTYNGITPTVGEVTITQLSSTSPNVYIDTQTGAIMVAPQTPAGTYTVTYEITDKLGNENKSSVTVTVTIGLPELTVAANDGSANGFSGGVAIENLLSRVTYNGKPATLNEVGLKLVSVDHQNIKLDPLTGKVSVDANTPSGTYTLVFEVVDKLNPSNIKQTTVKVRVSSASLAAANDNGTISGYIGGTTVANVLANDKINGQPASLSNVTLTQIASTNDGVYLENGTVKVKGGTRAGTYKLEYRITDKLDQANTSSAVVIVTVTGLEPLAKDDFSNNESGKVSVIAILDNDSAQDELTSLNIGSIMVKSQPDHGKVAVNPDGSVTYTSIKGYVGNDSFTYTVKNSFGYESNTATVRLTVLANKLLIPNAFTPNGDGNNDLFEVVGIEGYTNAELTVFNRWGNEVYRNKSYQNQWDGYGLNEGTYYYILIMKNGDKNEVYKGWVLLKR
ncbi:Calx-beta domain-containing protein [Hufsiella arboris]|nr:Calx-beta domain-containing protein [Hufsiella arboris]